MDAAVAHYDLLVIGAGINGAGLARDAAGRGLSVLVVEQDDIAAATSQWSTKLIHGGLRYLEYYEFRLVRESLSEREVVLKQAPHLVQPLQFVLPHEPHLRPAWMIRAGLLMYDHLSHRVTLPASFGVDLSTSKWGAGLKPSFHKGFVYADARVDDARLVLLNEMAARERGADVRVRTKLVGATRENGTWRATLVDADGARTDVTARAIANVAGPWVKVVRDTLAAAPSKENVRHVKGSHIVVPRVHPEDHAYLLQNADKRIVFVIPFEGKYSLIGTTDVPVDAFEHPEISAQEVDYLLALANAYLEKPLAREDIVWTFSGIRPLYDDGQSDPSAITRDYVLKLDAGAGDGTAGAPLLSVYGGKITTYRKLAEHVLDELRPYFPQMKPAWTLGVPLPGGDLPPGGLAAWIVEMRRRHPQLPEDIVDGIAHRHGSLAPKVLGDARQREDLGEDFGAGLTAAEIDYCIRHEWARTADDVLWRRTKCGLGMTPAQRERVAAYVAQRIAVPAAAATVQ
jgi:glycerol-3-phosphate dehydrogenase